MVSNVTKNRGVIEQSMRAPVVKLWWEHDKSFPSKRKEEQPFTSQFLKETKPQRQTSHDSFGFENMISPCSKGWTPSMAWQELGWWGPPGHPCPLPHCSFTAAHPSWPGFLQAPVQQSMPKPSSGRRQQAGVLPAERGAQQLPGAGL